jgi:hypothetical protein
MMPAAVRPWPTTSPTATASQPVAELEEVVPVPADVQRAGGGPVAHRDVPALARGVGQHGPLQTHRDLALLLMSAPQVFVAFLEFP